MRFQIALLRCSEGVTDAWRVRIELASFDCLSIFIWSFFCHAIEIPSLLVVIALQFLYRYNNLLESFRNSTAINLPQLYIINYNEWLHFLQVCFSRFRIFLLFSNSDWHGISERLRLSFICILCFYRANVIGWPFIIRKFDEMKQLWSFWYYSEATKFRKIHRKCRSLCRFLYDCEQMTVMKWIIICAYD